MRSMIPRDSSFSKTPNHLSDCPKSRKWRPSKTLNLPIVERVIRRWECRPAQLGSLYLKQRVDICEPCQLACDHRRGTLGILCRFAAIPRCIPQTDDAKRKPTAGAQGPHEGTLPFGNTRRMLGPMNQASCRMWSRETRHLLRALIPVNDFATLLCHDEVS